MKCPPPFHRSLLLLVPLVMSLSACGAGNRSSPHGIRFPDDAEVAKALAADFARDPDTSQARAMVALLGGDKATLGYRVRDVVARDKVFEAHYDVVLTLAQPGPDSLLKLYGSMVPASDRAQVPATDLAAHERWLATQVQALDKADPAQAQVLRRTVDAMGKCYRTAKAGDAVPLMDGLVAAVLPSRNGWHAEKLPAPRIVMRCLPA